VEIQTFRVVANVGVGCGKRLRPIRRFGIEISLFWFGVPFYMDNQKKILTLYGSKLKT
jgi:hypothetical protein